ncbi:uncharacterized protein LOC112046080 isoform X2 [Bicyclus anynana]|uniref:Uncharacterized protein LOC112046080 isoform X2 n=1 Tax=Bicyclus anynana TaxID=110368 RepID=A0ABM3LUN8_BICAN|nr:uncharacterized protein LOC112046080 isoform X2 [Bicyclus anynana]
MSIVGIAKVHKTVTLDDVLRPITSIRGLYEPMHNVRYKMNADYRTAYFRLSETVDPMEVVGKINKLSKVSRSTIRAFMPKREFIPDVPVPRKKPDHHAHKLAAVSTGLIVQEMQTKFAGLFDLSSVTSHKLLQDIAKTIYKRLRTLILQADKPQYQEKEMEHKLYSNTWTMTQAYRKRHPHFADFQLILSTLHAIQDAEGNPRAQIMESELTAFTAQSYTVDNIPFDQIQQAYHKYLEKITSTVTEHIKNLDMTPRTTSPEEIARIKIREQLKTLLPYLPTIYGEPALPARDAMAQFLRRHRLAGAARSPRMYNLLVLDVPKDQYLPLLHDDSTVVGSSKLVIRPGNLSKYSLPMSSFRNIQLDVAKELISSLKEDWPEEQYY